MAEVNLHQASVADDPLRPAILGDGISLESLCQSFDENGFVIFHHALSPSLVSTLQSRLEEVLRGRFNRNSPPDKMPKLPTTANKSSKKGRSAKNNCSDNNNSMAAPLGYDGNSNNSRVLQIINIHKCDEDYRKLATSPEIGKMVAELAGWEHGARLTQDQVWAK